MLALVGVFDWANPDLAHASPLASHIVRSLHLYRDPPGSLPPRERNRRRSFFWSQYGLDLGRECSISRAAELTPVASLLFNFPVGFEGVHVTMGVSHRSTFGSQLTLSGLTQAVSTTR